MKSLREDDRPADLWFWSDWLSSIDVRSCSLAAQGLWANMLAIMSRSDRKGFLSINGKPMNSKELAKFVGDFTDKVEELLRELEYYSVYSRDEAGTIYNRRMARDAELSRKRAAAGRLGGLKQNASKSEAKVGSKREATLEDEDENDNDSEIRKRFAEFWSAYPKEGRLAKGLAREKFGALVKRGELAEFIKGFHGYLDYLKHQRIKNKFDQRPMYAGTFLGEEKGWREFVGFQYDPDL